MFAAAGCATSILIAVVLGVVVLRTTFVKHRQSTINMEPTILKGDTVVVRRAGSIGRGDLVVFTMPKGGVAIKRVIGLPGEVVELRGGIAAVNGTLLDEPYVSLREGAEPQIPVVRDMSPVRVPAGHFFLLGDNRDHSNDSRFIGPVNRRDIHSRAVVVLSEKNGVLWP